MCGNLLDLINLPQILGIIPINRHCISLILILFLDYLKQIIQTALS